MNPPSALNSAMNRDRKPFTYTPGGLDLSEIKSQRMAQRLMRNAMNPGVPEVAASSSPANPSSVPVIPLPNYNCLPVQVFPAMPANPKTLLRSRSNPDPRPLQAQRINPPQQFINNNNYENKNTTYSYENKPTYSQQLNNNRPISMYEYSTQLTNDFNAPRLNYGFDGYTVPSAVNIPSPAFAFTHVSAPISASVPAPVFAPEYEPAQLQPETNCEPEFFRIPKTYDDFTKREPSSMLDTTTLENKSVTKNNIDLNKDIVEEANVNCNYTENSLIDHVADPSLLVTKSSEENNGIDNEQKEVKIVKTAVTKEKKVEEQNGSQNGDTDEKAELTVKLPTKKSAAKTETKVEVEKKILPDGAIEEIKTTTTKTTIDGRTEIKTKTETKIIPKEEEYEEEIEEEEEEEETLEETEAQKKADIEESESITLTKTLTAPKQNGDIVKTEEKSETTVAKKVVIIQESEPDQVEEDETEDAEVEEEKSVTVVLKKQATPEPEVRSEVVDEENEEEAKPVQQEEKEEADEEEEEEDINVEESQKEVTVSKEVLKTDIVRDDDEEQEEEEEYEEAEEETNEAKVVDNIAKTETEEIVEDVEKEKPVEKEELIERVEQTQETVENKEIKKYTDKEDIVSEKSSDVPELPQKVEEHIIPVQISTNEDLKSETNEEKLTDKSAEFTIPLREPSIPLDKVEDVEIKPIGITPIITKSHTENTEIITSNVDQTGGISRQTEYNKIENIVTVNRTTKILDQNYESLTQQGIPTVKTYFAPPTLDRISTSPMLSRQYQPVYNTTEPTPERRHSLLLERLSMERQMPSDIYQYSNQSYEQTQYQDGPQSEILTVSNVKPSTITNQQWYQQTKQTQNVQYNNVTPTTTPVDAPWTQPKSPQPQQQYQTQPQYLSPSQPTYQAQYQTPQPQFQRGTTPLPQFQRGTTPQPQFQRGTTPQPQFQKPISQPQYQPAYNEPTRESTPAKSYSTYTPTPSWLGSNVDTTQNYQKDTFNTSTQQYTSSYVPPPWEQDSSYTSVNNTSEKYYQEIPQTNAFSPTPTQGWQAAPPNVKFTKPAPIAYVPPAPNQSFVKTGSNVEPPRQPGRKTYYSEYERRYITVPESTYIPTETKFQPQPDPSPQYYYDNNEPTENEEPQWRRELREFTEKTSSQTTEQTNVRPPWEGDSVYGKTPSVTYTPTPTWSQTLRPQSYRKRSFESEFVSQEWPKTNTLGRGRPLSTIGKSLEGAVPERARGVSVDRYNPNNYQPPAEHPPVQSHTLTTPLPHPGYHNPNVPGYHARVPTETREQPTNYQQRVYRESRASPLQSRSFKYLQWITGTEN